jgi:hypothetical protein
MTGHSLADVNAILERNYTSRGALVAALIKEEKGVDFPDSLPTA